MNARAILIRVRLKSKSQIGPRQRKSSPDIGKPGWKPREKWMLKNDSNIEYIGNREIHRIRENGLLFACFAYFAVEKNSWARIWGQNEPLIFDGLRWLIRISSKIRIHNL